MAFSTGIKAMAKLRSSSETETRTLAALKTICFMAGVSSYRKNMRPHLLTRATFSETYDTVMELISKQILLPGRIKWMNFMTECTQMVNRLGSKLSFKGLLPKQRSGHFVAHNNLTRAYICVGLGIVMWLRVWT